MNSLIWGYGSHARCDGKTLTLTLSLSMFPPNLWQRVGAWLQQRHDHWPNARGDLDARLGRVQDLAFGCGYLLGFLVDQLHKVITVVQVVAANTSQRTQLTPALDQHRERLGKNPRAVATDSAQDYYPVHQYLDAQQIEGHIAPRLRAAGDGLPPHHFVWDEQERLHCPAGREGADGRQAVEGRYAAFPGQRMCHLPGERELSA